MKPGPAKYIMFVYMYMCMMLYICCIKKLHVSIYLLIIYQFIVFVYAYVYIYTYTYACKASKTVETTPELLGGVGAYGQFAAWLMLPASWRSCARLQRMTRSDLLALTLSLSLSLALFICSSVRI